MSKFFPLHVHSHASLLDGLSKPRDIARRCKDLGLQGSALTDHGTLAESVAFVSAMEKKGLKPILGCEFYVCEGDADDKENRTRHNTHLVVLAKNLKGWQDLIAATSQASHPEYYFYVPRLSLKDLDNFCSKNWISFSGHMGSHLANLIFDDFRDAYSARTYEAAKKLIHPDWVQRTTEKALELQRIFGKGNFYIEIQTIDQENLPAARLVAEGLRYISKKTGIPCVATPDAHYAYPEDAEDQRVLLCNHPSINASLKDIQRKMVRGDDVSLGAFFRSRNYYIPGYDDMKDIHTEEELENTVKIADACETYKITHAPIPPKFLLPEGVSAAEQLRKRCREGWKKRWPLIEEVIRTTDYTKQTYVDRLEMEMNVFENAFKSLEDKGSGNLCDYCLIVDDIVRYARDDGQLTGAGRGSGDGSLVLYLLEVGHIDPIEHDLMFERFYNDGRNTAERVSLPDVDMDFEKTGRAKIMQYIKDKFGHDKVAQMITFTRMQGRTALKDVLRAHDACNPTEQNKITSNIPNENDIKDKLEEMKKADKEAGGDGVASIIQWSLENNPKPFKEWCHIDEKGKLQGPMSKLFAQAIRLEGTKRSRGKHPAGIVIANVPIGTICPMLFDKNLGEAVAGMEMGELEAMGQIKFDILAIAVLDKTRGVVDLLFSGELQR